MIRMKHALILALALCSPAFADCAHNWMECTADSTLKIGSFTLRATEVIGSITASRDAALQSPIDARSLRVLSVIVPLARRGKNPRPWIGVILGVLLFSLLTFIDWLLR